MSCSSISVVSSYAREIAGTQVNSSFFLILAKIGMFQISAKVTSVKSSANQCRQIHSRTGHENPEGE